MMGTKWASTSLTFSFPTSASQYSYTGEPTANFRPFTAVQQEAVRDVLENFAAVSNLTFTEITETSSQHATLRFAESDSPSTAWAYYPHTSDQGGDAWFGSLSQFDNPVKGNYGYFTMMHETGHALGLKHAHETVGSFSALPVAYDSVEYSVMSYKSYVGATTGGYTISSGSYPQTLMMLDIAAIQKMYGADYTTNAGTSVYSWSVTTAEMSINGVGQGAPLSNKIFMTIWDGGGEDTYDFSNYVTDVKIDLGPGGWSTASTTQLASLGSGHYAAGNIANALLYQGNTASLIENAVGGTGNDTLVGNIANNKLTGGMGNDLLDGEEGSDTAIYLGQSASYTVQQNADGSWTVTDLGSGKLDGTDTLWNMEFVQFGDQMVALGGSTAPPPPQPTNLAPVYVSPPPSALLTEWADNSANEVANALHTASGQLQFTDADAGDVHAASFTPKGTGYLGTFSLSGVNQTTDTFNWSFAVNDSAMDYLRAGQTLTQSYDVMLDDGHGGTSVQTVTIALAGADDLVVKAAKGGAGGKGKGGGNDVGNGNGNGSHELSFADMINEQAPAPQPDVPVTTYSGILVLGLDQLSEWALA